MSQPKLTVFISYAQEDLEAAKRLFADLKENGAEPWLDKESLLPGQNWKVETKRAIRESRYFLALFSSKSVSRKGYVHKQMTEALEILDEFPESDIYIIPTRLDDCSPSHEKLRDFHVVDMFPSWDYGFKTILDAIGVQPRGNSLKKILHGTRVQLLGEGIKWEQVRAIAKVIGVFLLITLIGVTLIGVLITLDISLLPPGASLPFARLSKTPTDTPVPTDAPTPTETLRPSPTLTVNPTDTATFTPPTTVTFIPSPKDTPLPQPTATPIIVTTESPTPMPPPPPPQPTPHLTGKIAYGMSDGIYIMDADGNNRRRVYKGRGVRPVLSPDGKRIAFVKWGSGPEDGLWVMNVDGSNIQQIVNSGGIGCAVWASDSSQIAYADSGTGYIIKIPGGIPQHICGQLINNLAWSPDGKWFAYHSRQGLVKEPLSGGALFVLDPYTNWGDGQPAWSPDGTKIAYLKDGDIFVIRADGVGQKNLTDHPVLDSYPCSHPCWSPDSTKIVFNVDRKNGNYEIYVMNTDGSGVPMNLTNSADGEWYPTWAQ